ncbi:MAG: type III pantothenate kinase, partial [Victivallales bacterium]|nr:type III pantothenate kinase [Victivallales bacterium]
AAALAAVGHVPVAVFDFGTCIASAVIDSRNRLLGGVIAPGRRLLRFALHEHTAQLPNIPLQAERPEAIGNNTLKAMVAGTDLGILGTARFLVEETRKALNAPHCTVFATGGDAPYFLKNLDGLSQAPELLTLRGIISARPAM